MKRIILVILLFIFILPVKALEEIPNNIYYIDDNNLIAYLDDITLDEESKLYIEFKFSNGEKTDLIEITELPFKTTILENVEESLEIESRFIKYDGNYDYSEWSDKKEITSFDFEKIPTPIISNVDSDLNYNIDNKEEIEELFKDYIKVNNLKANYKLEYKVNDSKWEQNINKYDKNDVKIEIRLKYEIGTYESEYSNTLVYEKHPEKVCPFDSDICCNEIANMSLCYWLMILGVTITVIFIIVDIKKRISREA